MFLITSFVLLVGGLVGWEHIIAAFGISSGKSRRLGPTSFYTDTKV